MSVSLTPWDIASRIEYKYSAFWLKIFDHKFGSGVLFSSEAEALSCNTESKYSILGNITSEFKMKDKYEFVLEYPGTEGYNRWRQSSFPSETTETVTGYEPLKLTWTNLGWGGLARSSRSAFAFIDGSPNVSTWYFTIGAFKDAKSVSPLFTPNGIPGPINCVGFPEVVLWLRTNDYHRCTWRRRFRAPPFFFFFVFASLFDPLFEISLFFFSSFSDLFFFNL
jgi:hypothetical protein